jgi:hypothetical protein
VEVFLEMFLDTCRYGQFFLFWYVELVLAVCPHLSVTLCICFFVFVVPSPKFYIQVNPIQIHFDLCSCLWLSSFALNLHQSLLSSSPERQQAAAALMYMDVKLEAIMPRVCHTSLCVVH